ncbi:MAG: InlB B-repeat-containing protein [Firmicutes bacterium]|nr:InlB B-repeat-containing protein [Candidatus Caballimonas caccae]
MKKIILFLTILCTLSFCAFAVSCGKDDSDENPPTPPQQETTFSISFRDENGDLLETKIYKENETPSYNYEKTDTDEWDYTVEGWSDTLNGSLIEISKATEDATYYAKVSKVKQKYTLTFETNGGSNVSSLTVDYGTTINAPEEPTKNGCVFVAWCSDVNLTTTVSWPVTLTKNTTVYVKWNEVVSLKTYLNSLISATNQDPYSYIPNTMRASNSSKFVQQSEVSYNFSNFTNVSSIKYGGFGEQWQMVLDNIQQSENFYKVFTLADSIISSSVVTFNNWFDNNPSSTNKEITETGYYAKVDFKNKVLSYTLQLKTTKTLPVFGEVTPQIDMTYNIETNEKTVRINLTDTNALRYIITENSYTFAIKYGLESVSRNAYCEITKDDYDKIEGHIYEYITLKGKDAVKSCSDFYIDDTYTSVVGNKASGIILMDGTINELYSVSNGNLLGYKVEETKTIAGITGIYNTLWFNLNNISGINSVKVTAHTELNTNEKNANDIYVNGSSTFFTPTYNTKLLVKTSRKYDIELRKQYFYGLVNNELVKYEKDTPMMFIQDDNDKDTNYSDFISDIKKDNNITASVNLSNVYLSKIRSDYNNLIPEFKQNKELFNSQAIIEFIGSKIS